MHQPWLSPLSTHEDMHDRACGSNMPRIMPEPVWFLLAESLLPALSVFNDTIADEVVYSDVPLPGHEGARSLVAAALTQAGDGDLERGLRRHLHEHARELFFRKLTDWVTEREYRYLILDNNPLDVSAPYRDALQAVIVGERFPQWQIPGAALVCSAADATLRQMQWGASPPGVFDPTVSETKADLVSAAQGRREGIEDCLGSHHALPATSDQRPPMQAVTARLSARRLSWMPGMGSNGPQRHRDDYGQSCRPRPTPIESAAQGA